jgi:hypothetical protein
VLDGARSSRRSRTSASVNPRAPSSPRAASYHCGRQVFMRNEEMSSQCADGIGGLYALHQARSGRRDAIG